MVFSDLPGICGLASAVTDFGNFSHDYIKCFFWSILTLFSFWYLSYVAPLETVPPFLDSLCVCSHSFISLCFSLGCFYQRAVKLTDSSLGHVQFTEDPNKGIPGLLVFLISSISF